MQCPQIIVLTECASPPFGSGTDHRVFVNPAHIVSWTSARTPDGATAIQLVIGQDTMNELFVRESPEKVFELVTGEYLSEVDEAYEAMRADLLP